MNEKNLKLLNEFANGLSLATNIKVDITEHSRHLAPRTKKSFAKYEEANMLMDLVRGAEHFLWYLERGKYEIRRKKKVD